MIYSCCASMEQYDRVRLAGYDRIILSGVELTSMDESAFQNTRSVLASGQLDCRALNDFCTDQLKLCSPGFDRLAVRDYIQRLAARSALLGVEYIGVGSPNSRNIAGDYSRPRALGEFKESLAVICTEAAAFGIQVLLEPVCSIECNFINYTDEGLEIIRSMGMDNLHLVYDTYHACMMKEDGQPLQRAMAEVRLVHVAQDIGQTRRCPQKGFVERHRVYFETLLQNGFSGEIAVEARLTGADGELVEALSILKTLCGERI